MCMTCAVCMMCSIISGACTYVLYQSDSSCVGVSSVQCTVRMYSMCMFCTYVHLCVVFSSLKLLHTPVPVVVGSSLSSRDCSTLVSLPHLIRQCSSPTNEAYSVYPPHL